MSLEFRYGCVGSSKSAELLIVAHNYDKKGMFPLVLKPSIDTRDVGIIKSRVGISRECVLFENDCNLYELINSTNTFEHISCVLVDESQFMTVEQVRQLWRISIELDIPVLCYGLKIDYKGNGFESSKELMVLSHKLQEIKTVCKCGNKATHHLLIVDNKYRFDGNGIFIGDTEYESVCGKCFLSVKNKYGNTYLQ